ncbi:hypothetical protein [Streptomyces niveus]|uniref:hypothetical protein n=1 Tax=Streptomyces niveus TaxID=193462 RepID=UPI00342CD375
MLNLRRAAVTIGAALLAVTGLTAGAPAAPGRPTTATRVVAVSEALALVGSTKRCARDSAPVSFSSAAVADPYRCEACRLMWGDLICCTINTKCCGTPARTENKEKAVEPKQPAQPRAPMQST